MVEVIGWTILLALTAAWCVNVYKLITAKGASQGIILLRIVGVLIMPVAVLMAFVANKPAAPPQ